MGVSLGIHEVCEASRAAIFCFAVSQQELIDMKLLCADCSTGESTPWERAGRLRALAQLAVNKPSVAQQLTDVLDLRHADMLFHIRALEEGQLPLLARQWLASPDVELLPGLIWSLCTDHRPAARETGVNLATEAAWIGVQALFQARARFEADEEPPR